MGQSHRQRGGGHHRLQEWGPTEMDDYGDWNSSAYPRHGALAAGEASRKIVARRLASAEKFDADLDARLRRGSAFRG